MKRFKWFNVVEKATMEALTIIMTLDETDSGVVADIIHHDIQREFDQPERMLHTTAVIIDGRVHLKLAAIMGSLSYTKTSIKSTRQLGKILRDFGFANGTTRTQNGVHRTWSVSAAHFESVTLLRDSVSEKV